MLILGLTGGIATGKSTVSNLLKSKNITVIDCDEIAHDVTKKVMPETQWSLRHTFPALQDVLDL